MIDYYFSGVPIPSLASEYLFTHDACILASQLNERKLIKQWIELFKSNPSHRCKLFIDSGAFSAWTRGKSIDLDEYISFLNENHEYFTLYASVDVIPGKFINTLSSSMSGGLSSMEAAEASWRNFLYMRERVENTDKLLYTYHIGEPIEFLTQALEYKDQYGQIQYIGLGGLVGKEPYLIDSFLKTCFNIIKDSSNPNVCTHAFGMTRAEYLRKYPLTSCDSTSWLRASQYGSIVLNNKTYLVSDKQWSDDNNILNKNPEIQNRILSIISENGYTLQDLAEDYRVRQLFNVISFLNYSKTLEYNDTQFCKQDLW